MKFYYEVAPNKTVIKNSHFLTYHSNKKLQSGQIVEIPIGKKNIIGIVWKKVEKPTFDTKEIIRCYPTPLPKHLLEASRWISEYYQTPLGKVISAILPKGIFKNRRNKLVTESYTSKNSRTNFVYTNSQKDAIKKIDAINSGSIILHGITGSGKTEVYINQAKKVVASGKSVIVLTPEIALTSQLLINFKREFNNIKVVHSGLKETERFNIWNNIINDNSPQIIIGARSAIFSPVKELGLIIIDEAHEPSFKQEQAPKYSALRLASFLASKLKFKVILGSATPLVEDYFLAKKSNKNIIELTELANNNATKPILEIIDLSKEKSHPFLSAKLIQNIKDNIKNGQQTLIYHNRRGTAPITLCQNCGWQANCPNCFFPLTLHHDMFTLLCHTCGHKHNIPTSCPDCGKADIIYKGIGTKNIEQELKKLFPEASIVRFDADIDKDKTVDKLYNEIIGGDFDIIIGTQIIAKGLDIPKLKTVGIIQAETGLSLPDFTSSERTFQLISQVTGRVGRHSNNTNVILQTYQPENPIILYGLNQDYHNFYNYELNIRQKTFFPPFSFLLKLNCTYKTEKTTIQNTRKEANNIKKQFGDKIQILGPTPAFHEKTNAGYKWQIVVRAKKRSILLDIAANYSEKPHWSIDIDPPTLL